MSTAINIGIPEADRLAVVDGLARLLVDSNRLYTKTRIYHWNVTGPWFGELHALFEAHYRELADAIDGIAERVRALGAFAPGDQREAAAEVRVAYDEDGSTPDAISMLVKLVQGHEAVIRTTRELLPLAERAGDEVTQDLLTGRLTIHEKAAWMLRSHLA